MKTYECIAHSGNTGKQIVILVRAISPTMPNEMHWLRQDSNLDQALALLLLSALKKSNCFVFERFHTC